MLKQYKLLIFALSFLAAFFLFVFFLEKENMIDNDFLEDVFEENLAPVQKEVIPEGPLKIGFITDAHCYAKYDKNSQQWVLNWRCEEPLEAFVEKMNNVYKPDFIVEGGDFVDGRDRRSKETFIDANKFLNQVDAPKYHVLGNHETRGFVKSEWLELVGYEKPYYYFDSKGYRIIVLDGNNKPLLEGGSIETSPELEFYPGFIDKEQMFWLEELLEESQGYQKIVFVHQPLATEERKTQEQLFLGGKELRKLFSENKVRAVFSGHIERFCLMREAGVEYYVSQGFWKSNGGLKKEYRFKDGGVFNEILINGNEIKVTAFYNPSTNNKGEYQEIELNTENADCSSGSMLYEKEDIESEDVEEN